MTSNTVANAITAACELGVWMLTVHVQGGVAMLQAARYAVDSFVGKRPKLVGVTVLTNSVIRICASSASNTVDQLVLRYADLAQQASWMCGLWRGWLEINTMRRYC